VEARRDERTVRVGGRKVSGIAAHRGRLATLVHGTLLVRADLDALRACIAGPRAGALEGLPRPAASRPDSVANVDVPLEEAEMAVLRAFEGAPAGLDAEAARRRDELERGRYASRAWHAGPWAAVTPPAVADVLGGEGPLGP
jgi:lipoate-protein ligase A